jgi:hypothetical protein
MQSSHGDEVFASASRSVGRLGGNMRVSLRLLMAAAAALAFSFG